MKCMRKPFASPLDAVLSYFTSISASVLLFCFFHFSRCLIEWPFVLAALVLPWLFLCGPLRIGQRFSIAVFILIAAFLSTLLIVQLVNRYRDTHDGQRAYFEDRKVLVLMPHQDDDLFTLAGILDRYADVGEITVAFSTNGDYAPDRTLRLREAVHALRLGGIPEDHIVFLGYGDGWKTEYGHIYLAPENEIVPSSWGATHTFGIENKHAPFRSSDYTRANMLSDIQTLITELQPDTIYCIDFDRHFDHRGLSLLFEEAMGRILAQNDAYHPLVFKAFAYETSLYLPIPDDWVNIPSTTLQSGLPHAVGNSAYLWERRIRLPISRRAAVMNENLSIVQLMADAYATQKLMVPIHCVLRGDKVFWRRYTDGVQYAASWTVSSGDADKLHDFKLLDMASDLYPSPTDGVWTPDADDTLRTVSIAFPHPQTLTSIILYDNPSIESNVLNARITFSDGSVIESGALLPTGADTEITFDAKTVDGFSVQILETEGDGCGFTEIEAYNGQHPADHAFVKLMDASGDFAYHYDLQGAKNAAFHVYEYMLPVSNDPAEEYTVETTGAVRAQWKDGAIVVTCPQGARGCLRIGSKSTKDLWDSIEIMNRPADARADANRNIYAYTAFRNFYSSQNLCMQTEYFKRKFVNVVRLYLGA